MTPRPSSEQGERCSTCSKADCWEMYDVFHFFTQRGKFVISRREFYEALKNCTSLKQLEVLRKSRLKQRFRESAKDVAVEEFLVNLWPTVTNKDMDKMVRWCYLREAQIALQGVRPEDVHRLREIFDLLDVNGDEKVSVEELQRAGILSLQQIQNIMQVAGQQHDAFRSKSLAAAVLFRKKIEDSGSMELGRVGGPLFDGKLGFHDFCAAVTSGIVRQSADPNSLFAAVRVL